MAAGEAVVLEGCESFELADFAEDDSGHFDRSLGFRLGFVIVVVTGLIRWLQLWCLCSCIVL